MDIFNTTISPQPLYSIDGIKLANNFQRLVWGDRGPYVELVWDDWAVELESVYKQPIPKAIDQNVNYDYYYLYLVPKGRKEKVYYQVKKVKYADYKVGYFYIDPILVITEQEYNKKLTEKG